MASRQVSKSLLVFLFLMAVHFSCGSKNQESDTENHNNQGKRIERPRRDIPDDGFFFRLFRPPRLMFKQMFGGNPWSPFFSKSQPWSAVQQHRARAWAMTSERREATAVLPGEHIHAVLTRGATRGDADRTAAAAPRVLDQPVVYVKRSRRPVWDTETRFTLFGDAVDAAIKGQDLHVIESAAPVSHEGKSLVIKALTQASRPPPTLRHCLRTLARQAPDFLPKVAHDFGLYDNDVPSRLNAHATQGKERGNQEKIVSYSHRHPSEHTAQKTTIGKIPDTKLTGVEGFSVRETKGNDFYEDTKRSTDSKTNEKSKGQEMKPLDTNYDFEKVKMNKANSHEKLQVSTTKYLNEDISLANEKSPFVEVSDVDKRNGEDSKDQQNQNTINNLVNVKNKDVELNAKRVKLETTNIKPVVEQELKAESANQKSKGGTNKDVSNANNDIGNNNNSNNDNNNKNNNNSGSKEIIGLSHKEQEIDEANIKIPAKEINLRKTTENSEKTTTKRFKKIEHKRLRSRRSMPKEVNSDKKAQQKTKDEPKSKEEEHKVKDKGDKAKDNAPLEPNVDIHAIVLVEEKTKDIKQEEKETSENSKSHNDGDPGYKTGEKGDRDKADKKKGGSGVHKKNHHHGSSKVTHVHAVVFLTVFLVVMLVVVGLAVHGSRQEARRAPSRTQLVNADETQPPSYF